MLGRRLPDSTDGRYPKLEPGDYIKIDGGAWKDSRPGDLWIVTAPNGAGCYLNPEHTFEEHEDGTLTVRPSILIWKWGPNGREGEAWHGFLERGVWRSC